MEIRGQPVRREDTRPADRALLGIIASLAELVQVVDLIPFG
jgi:hypothetical protein